MTSILYKKKRIYFFHLISNQQLNITRRSSTRGVKTQATMPQFSKEKTKIKELERLPEQSGIKKTVIKNKIKMNHFIRVQKKILLFKRKLHLKTKTKTGLNFEKSLSVGTIITGVISSIGQNNLGIIQFSKNLKVLVPLSLNNQNNIQTPSNIGDTIKMKIIKKLSYPKKFLLAKQIEIINRNPKELPTKVGDMINVQIIFSQKFVHITKIIDSSKKTDGLLFPYYFILKHDRCKVGDCLPVSVSHLKLNYGFAKAKTSSFNYTSQKQNTLLAVNNQLESGSQKLNIVLPKKVQFFGNLAVFKIQQQLKKLSSFSLTNNSQSILVFLKLEPGAQLGDQVQIKTSQIFQSNSGFFYCFAKILKNNQRYNGKNNLILSGFRFKTTYTQGNKKKVKETIEQMLKNGVHFGEKAVKSEAKMRNYIWISKKGKLKNRTFVRKGRHFLNLLKTYRCLKKTSFELAKYASKGRTFLFVGTKKPIASLIYRAAFFYKKSFYINTRWLGGMLTNWKTILKSILKIKPILKEKQRILQMILRKRQTIKLRLLKKIRVSIKHIQKGKQLLDLIKRNPIVFIQQKQQLATKRKELIQKGQELLLKRKLLLDKFNNLVQEFQLTKQKGTKIIKKYRLIINLLVTQKQKLKELENQALFRKELQKLKKNEVLLENVSVNSLKNKNYDRSVNSHEKIISSLGYIFKTFGLKNTDSDLLVRNLKKGTFESINISTNIIETSKILVSLLKELKQAFFKIQYKLNAFNQLKNNILSELQFIKKKLKSEQKILKLLKNKIKRSLSEKKFLQFLPQFKYHPPSSLDATNSVQFLMEKFVDPKIKQAIDSLQIYDEKLKTSSKKIASARKKKWLQLEKYFGGVANMLKMNKKKISTNVAIIVGQQEEMNAVRECQKLGIQMFHIVDTNCNPTLANHFIPANDNSYNSIKFIFTKLLKYIRLAQKLRLRLWKKSSTTQQEQKKLKNFL